MTDVHQIMLIGGPSCPVTRHTNFQRTLKRLALEMVHRAGSSHIGGNLSMAVQLLLLSATTFLSIDPLEPNSPNRIAALLFPRSCGSKSFMRQWHDAAFLMLRN